MKGNAGAQIQTFIGLVGATPGFAGAASTPEDQPPDHTQISDERITAAVRTDFPLVAGLFYNADGTLKP
jgi:hypothetical protein